MKINHCLIILLSTVFIFGCTNVKSKDYKSTPKAAMTQHTKTEELCWSIYREAQVYISKGNWLKGEEYCWKALNQLIDSDPLYAFGAMKNNLVRPLLMNGKHEIALKIAQEALEINKKTGDKVGIVVSYLNLSDVYELNNNLVKRNELWQTALLSAKESGDIELINEVQDRLSSIKK